MITYGGQAGCRRRASEWSSVTRHEHAFHHYDRSPSTADLATYAITEHRLPATLDSATEAPTNTSTARLNEYQVIGRHLPTDANPTPKLYRMRIFAPNNVIAKSRFWYFLAKLRKVKKANGEIVSLNQIMEKHSQKVKNFGIWIRYDSRSGIHNMYKEFREMSRCDAVTTMYQDMAARHRARFRSVHILKVVEIEKTADIRRPYIKQLNEAGLKFPLTHRVAKKPGKAIFSAVRPGTFA